MPRRYGPTRAIRALGPVNNSDLVAMVTATARRAAELLAWPSAISPDRAARVLHEYLRRRIRYRAEPARRQTVRYPSATVKDGVADCKSTAVFIASAAKAAGRHVLLRFIRQRPGDHWSHVYAVVDGIPVDPLLGFGKEAVHSHRLDVEI